MLERILDQYEEEQFLKVDEDGLDNAIIGVEEDSMRLIYSVSKSIEILTLKMGEEDTVDHFYFNIHGSHMGEKSPIWCMDY